MCGISGFIKFQNNLSVDILKKYSLLMANTLEKRGPDQLGYWCDETSGIALSHRRLSLIDLSTKANCQWFPLIKDTLLFLMERYIILNYQIIS